LSRHSPIVLTGHLRGQERRQKPAEPATVTPDPPPPCAGSSSRDRCACRPALYSRYVIKLDLS
jgi:hypothetical protein